MPSIDHAFLLELHEDYKKFKVFIESGTYRGGTIFGMEKYFEKLYTVEISKNHYDETKSIYERGCEGVPKINFYLGDSSIIFRELLPSIDEKAIFFLDCHWSAGDTGRGEKDCPLIEEIKCINKLFRNEAIIIIDDYSLFGKKLDQDWTDITKDKILDILKNRLSPCAIGTGLVEEYVVSGRLVIHLLPVRDIFIITSVINIGTIGWSYYPIRSLYSSEQRLRQTFETIDSVRKKSPESKILLVEASIIPDELRNILGSKCDYMYYLGDDNDTIHNCILSNCKGLGDAWLTYKSFEYIKNNGIVVANVFKLSGRYRLNTNFNRDNISNELPTFKQVSDNNFITFFFSVPSSLIDSCIDNLLKSVNLFKNRNDICIETYFPSLFPNKHIIEIIGAEGEIAIDETYSTYRV
jgi:hypothetical protein